MMVTTSSSFSWCLIMAAIITMMTTMTPLSVVHAQDCDASTGVCDKHERCSVWRDEGECLRNKAYMRQHCPVSCSGPDESYLTTTTATATTSSETDEDDDDDDECHDLHERCPTWADLGECNSNQAAMHKYCPYSCDMCDEYDDDDEEEMEMDPNCKDQHEQCAFWAEKGECDKNPGYMVRNCAVSCKTCDQVVKKKNTATAAATSRKLDEATVALLEQTATFGEKQTAEGSQADEILDSIRATVEYMQSDELKQSVPDKIRESCRNRHELCSFWQVIGECSKNKAYMTLHCAPVCQSCHLIDINSRCPKLENAVPALEPGDLNQMFQRIVATAPGNLTAEQLAQRETLGLLLYPEAQDLMPPYTVVVHSRPSEEPLTEISAVTDKSLPPWVITLENFLTDDEAEALIQLGYKYEYKRSEDVGAVKFDGTFGSVKSEGRTSENAWCSAQHGCREEEIPKRIHERMAHVMQIPPENSEDLQILKYAKGEFYKTHHDFIPHQKDRQCGPRILTFFLYLSDVEAGGGTNFPNLDLTINPKRGRALLWPSVLDSNPMVKDGRMMHQALAVEDGIKYAANGWIHMYDYQTPQKEGCN